MVNVLELKQQAAELGRETSLKMKQVNEGTITLAEFTQYMNGNGDGKTGAVARDAEISSGIKAFNAALGINNEPGHQGPLDDRPTSLKAKMAQENWARYKGLQKMAAENARNIVSGGTGQNQGSF